MQTPEQILKNNGLAYEYSHGLRVTPYEDALAEIQQLQSENQTLLDEVNRLNEHIESLEKYYDNLNR